MERLGWIADFAAVAAGGACGSMLRYAVMLAAVALPGGTSLVGTVVVNLLGCFAIGALVEWGMQGPAWLSPRSLLSLQVGFLGGLTTFSTFAAETVGLASNGRTLHVLLYLATHLVLGLAAVWIGAAWVRGSLG